jgi:hypothetical protein
VLLYPQKIGLYKSIHYAALHHRGLDRDLYMYIPMLLLLRQTFPFLLDWKQLLRKHAASSATSGDLVFPVICGVVRRRLLRHQYRVCRQQMSVIKQPLFGLRRACWTLRDPLPGHPIASSYFGNTLLTAWAGLGIYTAKRDAHAEEEDIFGAEESWLKV